jgi:hypothetical protein
MRRRRYASLISSSDALHIRPETIPFNGTLVTVAINYDRPLSLEQALRFRGKSHNPVDLVEMTYEETSDGRVSFPLCNEASGFGTRVAGVPIRQKLKNLTMLTKKKISVDFSGVPIISSSFADEVFGKLFVELGALTFMRSFELVKVEPTIQGLIDRAIEQRSRTGL